MNNLILNPENTTTSEPTGLKVFTPKGNIIQAQERQKLFFPVERKKMSSILALPAGALDHLTDAILVQTATGSKLVNVCSTQYSLISVQEIIEIIEPIEDMLDGLFDYEVRYRQVGYSKFYIDYKIITPKTLEIQVGDIVNPMISIQHSYSGEQKYRAEYKLHRLVCANGMTVPVLDKSKSVVTKHTVGSLQGAIERSINQLEDFVTNSADYIKMYDSLKTKPVGNLSELIDKAIQGTGYPKKLKGNVVNRFLEERSKLGLPKNQFLVYNAMNYQLNHDYKGLKMQEQNRLKLDSKLVNWFVNN